MRRKVPDMPSSTPLSTNACARLTRRSVLALPALTGAGVVLASCGVLKKGGSVSSDRRTRRFRRSLQRAHPHGRLAGEYRLKRKTGPRSFAHMVPSS